MLRSVYGAIPTAEGTERPMAVGFRLLRLVAAVALVAFVVANFLMVALHGAAILLGSDALDLAVYREALSRYGSSDLYGTYFNNVGWRYSPLAVWPFGAFSLIGQDAWRILHVAALLLLPGWRRWAALGSYPFWSDLHAGNILVFVLVAGCWALRGNRWGILGTLVFALLVPRPLIVPLVAWILWRHPAWRMPFAGLFVAHAIGVLATGYGPQWLERLLEVGGEEVVRNVNVAPSAIVGAWWLVAAVPLATVAFWAGFPAAAGLLLQPYWLPHYLLMLLADDSLPAIARRLGLRPLKRRSRSPSVPSPAT